MDEGLDGFDANLRDLHLFRAKRALPGPNYYYVLRTIHQTARPSTYVEIGVNQGDSLQVVQPGTAWIGVDPALPPTLEAPSDCRLFRMTSNAFFERHDLTALLGGRPFSLAFIDGLHLFEQALRDVINLERHAGPDSIVLLHDCLPLDAVTSARVRETQFYSGDVWKLTLCIRQWRPDLTMAIIPTAPTGLSVVSGLNPRSAILSAGYDRCLAEYLPLTFEDYVMRRHQLPLSIRNTRADVAAYIARLTGRVATAERQSQPDGTPR
jgi:hypothetical protein